MRVNCGGKPVRAVCNNEKEGIIETDLVGDDGEGKKELYQKDLVAICWNA